MSATWRNWARTERCTPALSIAPKTVEQVQLAVRRAAETGHGVKPIGASHSFTAIGATDGIRIDMSNLRGLVSADAGRGRVTLWAGTHLWELPGILDPLGLALANMGDIDRQTISGATQTGTHGTGLGLGGLATAIVGLTLVTGEGEVLEIDESDRDLLDAAALSLGALGVIVTITLQCVPSFLLRAQEGTAQLREVLDNYDELARSTDHFEFFWFPHTDTVRTKFNTRLPESAGISAPSAFARWLDEEFVNNTLLEAVVNVERVVPRSIPTINRLINGVSSVRDYTDRSYRVFITNRRVRFRESEFSVPLEAVPHAVRDIEHMISRKRLNISFPIEVRNAASDSLMLSTASGRESGYIAVHRFYKEDHRLYFAEVQAIMRSYGGRPHWGKMHSLDSAYFADQYPRFGEFAAVRDRLDPHRIFVNPYLDRVLGA
ncbi:FAD-binding protein [Leucobacter sp. UCMA 4100]|uniref:D-arabinono-1,4-lactone oxidase n=1 Tax=Leucobacter sp. UCMA 4100 TaxID=2810534 RepID=UPI0022EA96C6|nr:D-arabinono-1,4-lactone oxidase [Leucobacter sp. UCMA 4100]MDA3147843.1 FAD-binding protein [Leucobacter sp. UCMA 4100]